MKSIAAATEGYSVLSRIKLRHPKKMVVIAMVFVCALLPACEVTPDRQMMKAQYEKTANTSDDFLVVDCLLPGQMRKLGGKFTFLTQRRPIKTAQSDCEIRGGEYVAFDRADYSTALRIWLPLAQAGDAAAQTYVGEIYEKGLGLGADYTVAANWYAKAVKAGYSRAQINLGHLYEKGLGVEQNKQEALNLYRSASGLGADNLLFASTLSTSHVLIQDYETVQRELVREQRRGEQLKKEMRLVNKELSQQSDVLSEAEQRLLATQTQLEQAIAAQTGVTDKSPTVASSKDERELVANVELMEDFRTSLEKQMAELRRENRELTDSQQALVEQLSGNEKTRNQYQQQMAQLEQQISMSRKNMAQSELELTAAQTNLAQQRARTQSQTPELIRLQRELDAKNLALTEEQVRLARMESQRSSLTEQLSRTEKRMGEYQQQIAQMQQQLRTAKQEVARSEQDVETLKAQLEQKLARDAELTPTLLALQNDLEEKNRILAKQRHHYTALETEKDSLANQLAGSEQQKVDFRRQSNQLREQLVSTGQALFAARADVTRLNSELATVQNKESPISAELKSLQSALEEKNELVRAQKVKFATLESQNSAQRAQLNQALEELNRQSQSLAKAKENYRSDITRLNNALAEREQRANQVGKELLLAKAAMHMERASSEEALSAQADAHQEVVQRQQAELQQLTSQFESQYQHVKSQKRQIAVLKRKIQGYELEIESTDTPTESYPQVAANGPTIEIIEPPVVLTRSQATVRLQTFRGERQVIGKIFAPSGLLSLSVNGVSPKLTDNNLFRASVPLTEDPTPVEVVLVDNEGRRAAVTFSFVDQEMNVSGQVAPPVFGTTSRSTIKVSGKVAMGDYHALIIGNNEYKNYSTLVTPVNDARETEKVLREKYRFKTTLLVNANRYEILSALNNLRETLDKEDNLLIYYAGHGKIDESKNEGYWLPIDAEADNNINWISNKSITDILNVIEAKHILVVADSCYAGTLTQTPIARVQAEISDDVRTEWMKVMAETRARITLTSGGVEPVLDGGGGRHSVFSKAFLNTLQNNNKILEGYTLYSRVLEVMAGQTSPLGQSQTPLYAPIHLAGHESGEFFFNPRRG